MEIFMFLLGPPFEPICLSHRNSETSSLSSLGTIVYVAGYSMCYRNITRITGTHMQFVSASPICQ